MTVSVWNPADYLNARQTAILLTQDPPRFKERYSTIEGVQEPVSFDDEGQPYWTPDQVREMRAVVERGSLPRPSKMPRWEDGELIRSKVFGALHNPPIQIRSVSANLARGRRQIAEGNPPKVLPPEPHKVLFNHPLYRPEDITNYLNERPGYGNFTSGPDRRGYTGGRIPKGRSKLELAAASQ